MGLSVADFPGDRVVEAQELAREGGGGELALA
jgi:hypothetical protein